MVIDPETKKYIDEQSSNMSLKISSFFSALCERLENKGVLNPGEFNEILFQAQQTASFAQALGHGKIENFHKLFIDAVKDMEKQAQKRDWKDLK